MEAPTILELDKKSGELNPSTVFPGYVEFTPSESVRKQIEAYLANELTLAIEDYQSIWNEARENIETYKATKKVSTDGADILPSPMARVAADQIIARAYNILLRPKPVLSVEPYFPQEYDVMIPVEMPVPNPMTGAIEGTQTVPVPVKRDAEKVAMTWELGYEFLLRERLNFPRKLRQVLYDTVTGASPCWVKVCYHSESRTVLEPTTKGAFVDLSEKREAEVPVGDPIKWPVLPVFNVIRPLDEHDVQASPWIAENANLTQQDFLLAFNRGEYPLITEEEAEKLSSLTYDPSQNTQKIQVEQATQRAVASTPRQKCDVWEVWFYWDVRVPAEDGSKRKAVKRLSLMGYFHRGANRLLSCFRNPYDHQLRPYVPFFQMEDPHTLSGSSTVSVIKYHQAVKTQAIGLEIENASGINNVAFFADPQSDAFEYLQANKRIRPNAVIPKREDDYLEKFNKSLSHYSLLPLTQYIDTDGMRAVNMSPAELGAEVPNRTAAGTVSQILSQGDAQNMMFLKNISDRFSEVIKLDLRTRRQFSPLGETLHVKDPETQQILEVLFQFPTEDVIDNFRFSLTAADEELAKEHELPQLMALQKMNQERANYIAQVVGPMVDPRMMPEQVTLLQKFLAADQAINDRIISLSRTDVKKFDYTEQIAAIVEARNAALAQQIGAASGTQTGGTDSVAGGVSGPVADPQNQSGNGGGDGTPPTAPPAPPPMA